MRNLNLSKKLIPIFKRQLNRKFESVIPDIKEVIIERYNDELVDVVENGSSKTDPAFYLDEFIERLDDFKYIEELENTMSLIVPDEDNMDFSGRLRVLETIMQGLSGLHVEMTEEEYVSVFGKRPINEETFDENVPLNERVYIIRYSSEIRKVEERLDKKFTVYPFSNTPPIDLLEAADKFVEENMDRWIEEVLEESNREVVSQLRGDIL